MITSGFKLQSINPWLSRFCDLLAILALLGTGEVVLEFALPLFCAAALSFGLGVTQDRVGRKIPPIVLIGIMSVFVLIAGMLIFRFHWHPLIVAAYLSMGVHSLIWFVRDESRVDAVRLFLGLVQVAVAAVLTPDLYIAFVIFVFMIAASLKISLLFLSGEFKRFGSDFLDRPLPYIFLFQSLGISFLVFICSLAIFPILPRAHTGFTAGWSQKPKVQQKGYTEQVNLGAIPQWSQNPGEEDRPALRLFLSPEVNAKNWQNHVPFGLVRGRVLDGFDGAKWRSIPSFSRRRNLKVLASRAARTLETHKIELIREPLDSEILPVPYGVTSLKLGMQTEDWAAHSTGSELWFVPGGDRRRFQYFAESVLKPTIADEPIPEHLELPQDWIGKSERWKQLADEITKRQGTAIAKIYAVMGYLNSGLYQVSVSTASNSARLTPELQKALKDPRKQLDIFLFTDHRGHCEYFASSAAFLLRLAGVPTRLVSGFRISSAPVGGVITARQRDAHAWIEAWDPTRGWIPLDPTPQVVRPHDSGLMEWASTVQDFFSAYWYRYVLGFDQEERRDRSLKAAREWVEEVKTGLSFGSSWQADSKVMILILPVLLVVLLGSGISVIKKRKGLKKSGIRKIQITWSFRWRRFWGALWIRRHLGLKLEDLSRHDVNPLIRQWGEILYRLRFGPVSPGSHQWGASLGQMKELERRWRSEVQYGHLSKR